MSDTLTAIDAGTGNEGDDLAFASQWRLMWIRFRRHRLAMMGGVVLLVLYFCALFCEFLSPLTPSQRHREYVRCPPQEIRFIDSNGRFHLRPFIYDVRQRQDVGKWQREYAVETTVLYPLELFARGPSYHFWSLFETDIHLFGAGERAPLFLFGTDELGRDLFTRILYGARISLTIGLVGVALTFFIGILLGGVAGYFGGWVDIVVQRGIEILMAIPQLPLWMALSATLPADWPPLRVYFGITIILSFMGWTGLARVVRGKFLSIREEDFVVAARLAGTGEFKIIFTHLLPSFLSHVITSATLAVPGMILGETALSFLGIGLQDPVVSWGVLLQKAQNFQAVAMAPWLLMPGLFVVLAVLAFNVVGDGMRDAADPYSS
ncbi:MAG: ABC transporter permease [Candidatus Latescibacterota bacterium]|nr:ABC transporter permease [Candidatus Latescibacterota bacterium]